MSWFGNKEEGDSKNRYDSEIPSLPKLPELPSLKNNFNLNPKEVHQLPSLPPSSFSDKLSQNMIKEAVSGKRGEEGSDDMDEDPRMSLPNLIQDDEDIEEIDDDDDSSLIPGPTRRAHAQEIPSGFYKAAQKVQEAEPVYIRIDKFQESLNLFKKIKEKISEIDELLSETNKIKEQEEKELQSWQQELVQMKDQIAKIDKDIFSKV